MNTRLILTLSISLGALANQISAMQPFDQAQGRETDAQKARRLRNLRNQAPTAAPAPISYDEWQYEKELTAQRITDLLDADEIEEAEIRAHNDAILAMQIAEQLRAQDAEIRTQNDEIIAMQIAEQLRAQDREDQERASLETARRLEAEWNRNQ